MVLMSDRGSALASVVSTTRPWHDCLTGFSLDAHLAEPSSYATDRNDWRRSSRTMLLLELAKYGLGEADLHAPVNWFASIAIADDDQGSLAGLAGPMSGDQVVLRTEQDVLLFLAAAPHPYAAGVRPDDVGIEVGLSHPSDADASRAWREESARALAMAERLGATA